MTHIYLYSVDTNDGVLCSTNKQRLLERMMKDGVRGEVRKTLIPKLDDRMAKLWSEQE